MQIVGYTRLLGLVREKKRCNPASLFFWAGRSPPTLTLPSFNITVKPGPMDQLAVFWAFHSCAYFPPSCLSYAEMANSSPLCPGMAGGAQVSDMAQEQEMVFFLRVYSANSANVTLGKKKYVYSPPGEY